MRLRVPQWSDGALTVNGQKKKVQPGFTDINVDGKCEIVLELEYKVRVNRVKIEGERYLESHCGPLLLAADTRFGTALTDSARFGAELAPLEDEDTLLCFKTGDVYLTDYASAGRKNESEYTVWIPEKY